MEYSVHRANVVDYFDMEKSLATHANKGNLIFITFCVVFKFSI